KGQCCSDAALALCHLLATKLRLPQSKETGLIYTHRDQNMLERACFAAKCVGKQLALNSAHEMADTFGKTRGMVHRRPDFVHWGGLSDEKCTCRGTDRTGR